MGLFRDIKFERGIVFQLRGEATNLLNWVNLSNPTASGPPTRDSGNNKVTSARSPRPQAPSASSRWAAG